MSDRDKIIAAAETLRDLISESKVYGDYIRSLDSLKKQPAANLRLADFKQALAAESETEKEISRKYAELTCYPEAAEFLTNEEAFLEIYTEVMKIIDSSCEIEMFGM